MALDLQALSISSAFSSILNFFKSQENNSKWKDLNNGAEGIFLIRMLANILNSISYKLVSARRENYLSTAQLLSSALGMAVNYGYSANRGSNQRRLIQLTADGNYTLPKFSVIGAYDSEHDIILLEDTVLTNQVTSELTVTVGTIKELSFQAGTNDFTVFQQFVEGISEDIMLFVDDVEVPTSKKMQDLIHDKYYVRTNPSGSVDIMYLNNATNATHAYGTESVIKLRYIELENINIGNFNEDMFVYGQLGDVLTINDFVDFEDIESIKRNAPLQHCTEGIVRSKVDYTSRTKELVPNIIDTDYVALTPSYTQMTYLKDDFTMLTDQEEESLLAKLKAGERLLGTLLPDTTPPRREVVTTDIDLVLYDKFKDVSEIKTDIDNLFLSNYETKLAQTFNIYDLENLLKDLSYVFKARVNFHVDERENTTLHQLGDIIQVNNNYYKAAKILGATGRTEPLWNVPQEPQFEVDTGLETEDGAIIWKCYKKLNVATQEWAPLAKHALGDFVTSALYPDYMFKCVDIKKYSATVPPDVTIISPGDFVVDGSIVWVCKTTNVSVPDRENSRLYRLGDSVNIGGATFECVSYVGYTASTSPNFEVLNYAITGVTENSILITGDVREFFFANDKVKVATDIFDYTYLVTKITYDEDAGTTKLDVAQNLDQTRTYETVTPLHRGTKDGEILWEIITDYKELSQVTYPWNTYNVFAYHLTTQAK